MKSIVFIFLFFISVPFIYAQDTFQTNKFKRNTFKLGMSSLPDRICFSYEHAFTKHISVGGMASYGGISFVGYNCNLFTRYYFNDFNEKGWFIEARGSYAQYKVDRVYDSSYKTPYENRYITHYLGEHTAAITYISAGLGGGYKAIFSKRFFVEFLAGMHYGKATFGQRDLYFTRTNVELFFGGSNNIQRIFNHTGPGFPLHLMINFGFAF